MMAGGTPIFGNFHMETRIKPGLGMKPDGCSRLEPETYWNYGSKCDTYPDDPDENVANT